MTNRFVISGLLFAAITAAGIAFFGWVIVVVLRAIARSLGLITAPRPPSLIALDHASAAPRMMRRCPQPVCRHDNPMYAHFCSRCGVALNHAAVGAERSPIAV